MKEDTRSLGPGSYVPTSLSPVRSSQMHAQQDRYRSRRGDQRAKRDLDIQTVEKLLVLSRE